MLLQNKKKANKQKNTNNNKRPANAPKSCFSYDYKSSCIHFFIKYHPGGLAVWHRRLKTWYSSGYCQAAAIIGSVLDLVGLVSVYCTCDWVGKQDSGITLVSSSICNFFLIVAAFTIIPADPPQRHTSMLLGLQWITTYNNPLKHWVCKFASNVIKVICHTRQPTYSTKMHHHNNTCNAIKDNKYNTRNAMLKQSIFTRHTGLSWSHNQPSTLA